MVALKCQLFVVFYMISGRYAYRDYLSDDANEYRHESNSDSSQNNSSKPPGKQVFLIEYSLHYKKLKEKNN